MLFAVEGLIRVARDVMGGLLEPPPRMVDEIFDWVKANVAIKEYHYLIEQRDIYKSLVDDELNIDSSRKKLLETEKNLKDVVAEIRGYSGAVSKKPWKKLSKKFKTDFSGWKYRKLLPSGAKDSITVRLNTNLGRGGAEWNNSRKQMTIWVSYSRMEYSDWQRQVAHLRGLIEHELSHWAQYFVDEQLGVEGFGLPSRSMRDTDIHQSPSGQTMKEKGIDRNEAHSLDDKEFYTNLRNEVNRYVQDGKSEDVRKFLLGNPFFEQLRKFNRNKWTKAVKEFSKAVR